MHLQLNNLIILSQALSLCPPSSSRPSAIKITAAVRGNPKFRLLAEKDEKFGHEGPVFVEEQNKMYFSSNVLSREGVQSIKVSRIDIETGKLETLYRVSREIPMVNGGFRAPNGEIIFCAQGHFNSTGGLYALDVNTLKSRLLVGDWNGKPFNSVNDLVISKKKRYVFFTDPDYGFEQRFKPTPSLGMWGTWLCNGSLENVKPILDGFVKPNGVTLSEDESTLYVSDTGYQKGDGSVDTKLPRTIYAFDLVNGLPRNRRVFAIADSGSPDGIKVRKGRVYAGCGDGIHVFEESTGDLVLKLKIDGGVANFAFAGNDLIMLNECRVYRVSDFE